MHLLISGKTRSEKNGSQTEKMKIMLRKEVGSAHPFVPWFKGASNLFSAPNGGGGVPPKKTKMRGEGKRDSLEHQKIKPKGVKKCERFRWRSPRTRGEPTAKRCADPYLLQQSKRAKKKGNIPSRGESV